MIIQAPPQHNPVIDRGRFTTFWAQWLRQLWTASGFNYAQPMYADLFCGALQMAEAVGDTSLVTIDGNMEAPQLRDGQDDGRVAQFRLGNDYRNNTDLEPFAVWAPQSAASGNVSIVLSWMASVEGSALAESTESEVITAAPGVAFAPTRTVLETIDGSDLVKGSIVQLLAKRDGDAALDTLSADCVLLGVGLKYQTDGVGNESLHP